MTAGTIIPGTPVLGRARVEAIVFDNPSPSAVRRLIWWLVCVGDTHAVEIEEENVGSARSR